MISMQRNSPEPQNHQNHQIRRNLWLLCGHFWPSFTLDQPRNSNALRRVTNSVQLCTYVLLQPSIIDPCACYIFTWFHLSVHVCTCLCTNPNFGSIFFSVGMEILSEWTWVSILHVASLGEDWQVSVIQWTWTANQSPNMNLPIWSQNVPKMLKSPTKQCFLRVFHIRGKGFTTKFGCKTHQRFAVLRTETNGQPHGGTWVCRKIENPKKSTGQSLSIYVHHNFLY